MLSIVMANDICTEINANKDTLKNIKEQASSQRVISGASILLKALSDPTRLRMVEALSNGKLCVCDLADLVGTSQSAVSHQLKTLRDSGVLKYHREGKMVYYSLDDNHVKSLIDSLFEHVDHSPNERGRLK
jgi:DNA-binding transcriptional ArsR family regulator